MNKETKLKRAIYQSRKTTMKSTTLNRSVEVLDGSLPRSTEITLLLNSRLRRPEERLRPQLPPPKNLRAKKVRKVKEVTPRAKPRRRRKKRRRPLLKPHLATLNQLTSLSSQLLMSLITTNNKILKES